MAASCAHPLSTYALCCPKSGSCLGPSRSTVMLQARLLREAGPGGEDAITASQFLPLSSFALGEPQFIFLTRHNDKVHIELQ